MIVLPFPTRWPVPRIGRVPPIITVGSIRAAMAMWVHIEVVDVFPWVPEMHRAFSYRLIMDPQAWARSNTGMSRAWAAAISGYHRGQRRCGSPGPCPPHSSPRWPMTTGMPRERRWVYRRALFHIRAGDDQAFSVEHFCQGGHGHSANPHQMRPFPGYNVIMDSIVCHCGLHTFSLPL